MHNDSSFRNLKVWQLAMVLVEDVYRVTTAFRVQERFGLTSQLRRAAVSVPSNVGEGKRRSAKRRSRIISTSRLDHKASSRCNSKSQSW